MTLDVFMHRLWSAYTADIMSTVVFAAVFAIAATLIDGGDRWVAGVFVFLTGVLYPLTFAATCSCTMLFVFYTVLESFMETGLSDFERPMTAEPFKSVHGDTE